MPGLRVLQLIVPVADSGQGCIHDHPFRDALRIERGECVAHHIADVVGDESGVPDVQTIQDRGEVVRLSDFFVTTFRVGRKTHPAQIGNDDSVILDQAHGQREPHVPGIAEAVQKEDGRTLAADTDILSAV
jgi:hypothetical protein